MNLIYKYIYIYIYIYINYCFPNESCRKGEKQAQATKFQASKSKFQAETKKLLQVSGRNQNKNIIR